MDVEGLIFQFGVKQRPRHHIWHKTDLVIIGRQFSLPDLVAGTLDLVAQGDPEFQRWLRITDAPYSTDLIQYRLYHTANPLPVIHWNSALKPSLMRLTGTAACKTFLESDDGTSLSRFSLPIPSYLIVTLLIMAPLIFF